MNRILTRTAAVLAAMFVFAPALATTEQATPADRAKLVQYLTSTRDQVLAEVEKLSDAQWAYKTAPERWSVGEVVEHLALAEPFLFDTQQKAMASPDATPEQKAATQGKDEILLKVIPDRTKKAQAPEPLQPGKRIGSRADVMAAFKDRRAKTLEYAGKTTDDLRAHVAQGPLGPLDGYQWLLFIGAHTERHLGQIREVKADAKFPKASVP